MNICILGSTGAVGEEFIKLIEERSFKFNNITLYASERSVGKKYIIKDKEYKVSKLEYDSKIFKNIDIAFFFISSELSKKYALLAESLNCYIIDNSNAFRMTHPLIIPEINFNELKKYKSKIIANPNCSTILLCMVLYPLTKLSKITDIVVSTYQALSGAGKKGIEELESQIRIYSKDRQIKPDFFKSQCLNNVFSHNSPVDIFTGDNQEETKIINETKKILKNSEINIVATCVRVPVIRAHCESINITFKDDIDLLEIKNILSEFKGITIVDDRKNNIFPEPIKASNQNDILVGRIRKHIKNNISLFISGDQLRKGAALNAIQIAEMITPKKLQKNNN